VQEILAPKEAAATGFDDAVFTEIKLKLFSLFFITAM